MSTTLTTTRRAVVCALLAVAQLVGAVVAGLSFALSGHEVLASASAALTCAVLLINRWYFRGWREFVIARRGRRSGGTAGTRIWGSNQ